MGDGTGDTRWLSYTELARAREISRASAIRLVFRKDWRRQVGNDGIAKVAVPVTETMRHGHDATYAIPGVAHGNPPTSTLSPPTTQQCLGWWT